jgi:hypothetical protein
MNENMVIILTALHTKDIQDDYAQALETKLKQLGLIDTYDCLIGTIWCTTSAGMSWLAEHYSKSED